MASIDTVRGRFGLIGSLEARPINRTVCTAMLTLPTEGEERRRERREVVEKDSGREGKERIARGSVRDRRCLWDLAGRDASPKKSRSEKGRYWGMGKPRLREPSLVEARLREAGRS